MHAKENPLEKKKGTNLYNTLLIYIGNAFQNLLFGTES